MSHLTTAPDQLLTLRALGLGDLLTAVPALRALRRAFPQHHHVLLTPSVLTPLAVATGAVDEVIGFDGREPALGGRELPDGLARPAVAVNLHGRGPDSHRRLLGLTPERLVAFRCDDAGWRSGPAWEPGGHEVDRWCALLQHHGIDATARDLTLPPPPAGGVGSCGRYTVVHPGASSEARRWPPARFAAVARAERDDGRRVVVTGTPAEARLVRSVARAAGLPPDACRLDLSLTELMALVAHADRVVCGDTGVAHLAVAYGTPSVVLFGPVPPAAWGPPPGRPQHRSLWSGTIGNPHDGDVDPGLLAISVPEVLDALEALPPRKAVRAC